MNVYFELLFLMKDLDKNHEGNWNVPAAALSSMIDDWVFNYGLNPFFSYDYLDDHQHITFIIKGCQTLAAAISRHKLGIYCYVDLIF